jgi:hypothetical protein
MAESPSSADARGVGTSRVAILKKISTLTRRHEGSHLHVRRIPLAPRELRGVHGTGTTSVDGGLAAQVPAAPAGEVRWDRQPRGVPADLRHLYPCGRRGLGHYGQLLPRCLDWDGPVLAHEPARGNPRLLARVVPQVHGNFESAYTRQGNETDLHAVQQRLGESLRSFIQRFSHVRNTIPRISNASVVVAFRQGVRDEKMLEKVATHDVQDVSALFSRADKCARAAEGCAWHSPAAPKSKEASKPNAGTSAQGVGGKGKKKKAGGSQSLAGHPPRRLSP